MTLLQSKTKIERVLSGKVSEAFYYSNNEANGKSPVEGW